jgi:hypothetical protein
VNVVFVAKWDESVNDASNATKIAYKVEYICKYNDYHIHDTTSKDKGHCRPAEAPPREKWMVLTGLGSRGWSPADQSKLAHVSHRKLGCMTVIA